MAGSRPKTFAYFDTSALIKGYVDDPAARRCRNSFAKATASPPPYFPWKSTARYDDGRRTGRSTAASLRPF
jgi:hypothetical protein